MMRPASPLDVPPPQRHGSALVASVGATAVHVALVVIAVFGGAHIAGKATQTTNVTQLVDVELPPPEVPPRPDALESAPTPLSKPIQVGGKPSSPETHPGAAQAGEVLKASDEVIDFGDNFVEGKGTGYAGGVTDDNGTSTRAQRDVGARGPGAPVVGVAPPEIDRSRPARLAGGSAWDCPFPIEADEAGIDNSVVSLRIEVAADGSVLSAVTTRDPGHGFGREARRCALSKHWSAGLDRAGRPIGSTIVVNVRFDR